MNTSRMALLLLVTIVVLLLGTRSAAADPGITERVSVDSEGNQGESVNYNTDGPAISASGRFVAFATSFSNLVSGDTNGEWDIIVHDRETGTTERVSVDSAGNQANGSSGDPAVSGDGRYVTFRSIASNLAPDDTNGLPDIFVHDRQTGITERVSVDSEGNQGNLQSGLSGSPAISANGRFVAFASLASNLVSGDTNGEWDIFVHDRQTGTTELVSTDSEGNQGDQGADDPALSDDGRYVAFSTWASNLVPGDTNGSWDVFVRDRLSETTERVSVDSAGTQGNCDSYSPTITADGRFIAFESCASDLVPADYNDAGDIFVHDRETEVTERVSVDSAANEGNEQSGSGAISADGRYVAFDSYASILVAGDSNDTPDVFVHDRQTATTTRLSVDSGGVESDGYSSYPSVSADGRYVAFDSDASNLVAGDTNASYDVFVRDRVTERVTADIEAGGTLTTDTESDGATSSDPVETSLTTPNAGVVSIEETAVTAQPPSGFQFLGQQVNITAPPATSADPLTIVFRIDSSQIPSGEDEYTVQIFKDGLQVPPCTGPPGHASPDPCISNRDLLPDGDIQIAALASSASSWNLAAVAPASPVGGVAELPGAAASPMATSGSSGPSVALSAVIAAAVVIAMGGAGWYARRRWGRP